MDSAQAGGASVFRGRKEFKRVVTVPQAAPVWNGYVSNSLPRKIPVDGKANMEYTAEGKPVISSQATEREIQAQHGYERE